MVAQPALSDADEIRIGHMLAERLVKDRGLVPSPQTGRVEKYLQAVGERVAANAPRHLPYHFRFDPEPGFKSAFALPGGEIFVGGGILAFLDSEDQLAVVLGHEIEHVALNQCRARLVSALYDNDIAPAEAEKLDIEEFFRGYGHDDEFTADREGVKLAAAAGYSPKAAIRLLETFLILAGRAPAFSNDADSNDSKKTLQERIDQIHSVMERDQLPVPHAEKPLALP